MSQSRRLAISGLCCLILVTLTSEPIWAMGQESFGPAGKHIGRTADWPKGVEDVLRHPSRVYWSWVNGNEHAYYEGGIEKVNELLDLFGRMDLNVHQIIVRCGSPEARSFHGKLVPYNVEFEVASGIYLHHIQESATTGLYCAIPRLTIHVDDRLAKAFDQLRFPENVTLRSCAYRVEDALAQLDSDDRSLHFRAITVLGEVGGSSPAVIEALNRAKANESEQVRSAADRALEHINRAADPATHPLRQRVSELLQGHPQFHRIPNAKELLAKLRDRDARYADGFTAKGTMIQPMASGWGQLVAWSVTMGDGRLVIQRRAVVDSNYQKREGTLNNTLYAGPNRMGTLHVSRLWADGGLIDTKPRATFEPVGSTYDLLIGRMLWPIGRGYSRRVDRITDVAPQPDGTLSVAAESDKGSLKMRWEMCIDPNADFLVRRARVFYRDQKEPSYTMDNSGVVGTTDCCTAHTARWISGAKGQPLSMSVTSVTREPDMELIRQTEAQLKEHAER